MTEKERLDEATRIAKEHGYDFAQYVGTQNGLRVYRADTNEPRDLGLPLWVTFDQNDTPQDVTGFQFMNLVKDE